LILQLLHVAAATKLSSSSSSHSRSSSSSLEFSFLITIASWEVTFKLASWEVMSVLFANIAKLFPLLTASSIIASRAVRIETVTESENHDRETHITSACVGGNTHP